MYVLLSSILIAISLLFTYFNQSIINSNAILNFNNIHDNSLSKNPNNYTLINTFKPLKILRESSRKLITFQDTIDVHSEDIKNPIALIKCANQTKCIQPNLQLRRLYKVYYCKHVSHGVRFYFLVREGLLLHPKILLVSSPEIADVIVYLPESAAWHKTECNKIEYRKKLLVLDEGDGHSLFEPQETQFLMQFKRSYVLRTNGIFRGYPNYIQRNDIFPMTYTIADAYVRNIFNRQTNRNIELLCTLRGSKGDPARYRVQQWVDEYAKARGIKNYLAKEVNTASRPTVSTSYFDSMHRAQIIVTANPSRWEGDFRLCEAMASGALVFVDDMYVPRPYRFHTGKHYIVYDNNNKTSLFEQLDIYRKDRELARRVAITGYIHAMTYHRAANLIDYAFRTLHTKQLLIHNKQIHIIHEYMKQLFISTSNTYNKTLINSLFAGIGYIDTGYHMHINAILKSKHINLHI